MPLIISIVICCTGVILFAATVYATKTLLKLCDVSELPQTIKACGFTADNL